MNIRDKVLLVEDERTIRSFMQAILTANGYDVLMAGTGAMANTMIASHCPDIIILDLGLPDMDGMTILRNVRKWSKVPILVVSARSHERDKVEALDAGADDYLTKPFRVAELRARVAAHLRREQRTPHARLRRGALDFDLGERAVYWKDTPLKLTKGEYAICEYLAMHPGQTFSKEQLYEAAFGYDGEADASAVTEHIKNIRAKLRPAGESPIETVWGVGYKWKNG